MQTKISSSRSFCRENPQPLQHVRSGKRTVVVPHPPHRFCGPRFAKPGITRAQPAGERTVYMSWGDLSEATTTGEVCDTSAMAVALGVFHFLPLGKVALVLF